MFNISIVYQKNTPFNSYIPIILIEGVVKPLNDVRHLVRKGINEFVTRRERT
jgi:hypothetical protein